MRGVFADLQTVFLGEVADLVHLARQSPPVDGQDRLSILSQTALAVVHVQVERLRIDVDEPGHYPQEPRRREPSSVDAVLVSSRPDSGTIQVSLASAPPADAASGPRQTSRNKLIKPTGVKELLGMETFLSSHKLS